MIRALLLTASALGYAPACAAQEAPPASVIATETSEVEGVNKIILVGDSTTATGNGWGPMFCANHTTHPTACLNLARNGRSSGSYRREGLWEIALGEMQVEGYGTTWVLFGFGHNDQPGKPGRSTDLETEFPANMRRYVEEARAAGAVPILFTPLTRRLFEEGEVVRDLDPWAAAIRQVAAETETPLIDLNLRSREIVQALGPSVQMLLAERVPSIEVAAAAALDGETIPSDTGAAPVPPLPENPRVARMNSRYDYTHLGSYGATLFAAVVADELVDLDAKIARLIRP